MYLSKSAVFVTIFANLAVSSNSLYVRLPTIFEEDSKYGVARVVNPLASILLLKSMETNILVLLLGLI